MATFVLKIKYGETLRRLTVPQGNGYPPSPAMSFRELEESIRKMFKLPSSSEIVLRYTDTDNDLITLSCDEDLHDACAVQGLNPLRLHVTLAAATTPPGPPEFLKAAFAKALDQGFVRQGGFGSLGRRGFWSCPAVQLEPLVRSSSPESSSNDEGSTSKGNGGNSTASAAAASDANDGVRHFGVQCDACNMFPIVGPRFKSKKKFDFDLCQACFFQKKIQCDDDEYTRIDRPIFRSQHFPSSSGRRRGAGCPAMGPWGCPRMGPSGWPLMSPSSGCPVMKDPSYCKGRPFFFMRGESEHRGGGGCGSSFAGEPAFAGEFACASGGKLDARFVQDVTIFDGTEVAPGTTFTKIWRLRNSGSLPWPKESRLVLVGGDELGPVEEATLELPEQGLAPEKEVQASVDLVAPMEPGRYVSYWRLLAPSGQKFGHRLWALIRVTPKDEESPQVAESLVEAQKINAQDGKQSVETSEEFGLAAVERDVLVQAQPEFKVLIPKIIAKNQQQLLPLDESSVRAETVAVVEEKANPVEAQQQQQQIEGEKIVYPEVYEEATAAPVTGAVELQAAVGDDAAAEDPSKDQEAGGLVEASELGSFSVIETTMLPPLESMGSKDNNLELSKPIKNDMQATPDAFLVTATDWDLKLEELEEMGFSDKQLNFRLMLKNKGSLKHVVKELVQMFKPPATAEKGNEAAKTV